jgi:hypothetical protein
MEAAAGELNPCSLSLTPGVTCGPAVVIALNITHLNIWDEHPGLEQGHTDYFLEDVSPRMKQPESMAASGTEHPAPVAGHAYYFLEDVYPRMTGRRPLKTPAFVRAMFPGEEAIAAPNFSAAAPPVRPPAPADAAGVQRPPPVIFCCNRLPGQGNVVILLQLTAVIRTASSGLSEDRSK